jgi:hypothetical protein
VLVAHHLEGQPYQDPHFKQLLLMSCNFSHILCSENVGSFDEVVEHFLEQQLLEGRVVP